MIKIRLKGRLGNQLFIYAIARSMCKRYNQDVIIYDRKDEDDDMWYSHLDDYKICNRIKFVSNKKEVMKMSIKSKIIFIYDRLAARILDINEYARFQEKNKIMYLNNGLFLRMDGYTEVPEKVKDDLFCDGYFQSEKYFSDVRDEILKEIVPTVEYNEYEQEICNKINKSNSVCVTIRLGDFVNNPVHQVCTKEYYYKAIDYLKNKLDNPHFFVFSDDMDGVKKMFDFGDNVTYDNGSMRDIISLDIMKQCKNFIISNSTFSWWAQYLSNYEKKIVVSPQRWYAQEVPCDLMSDEWIKID